MTLIIGYSITRRSTLEIIGELQLPLEGKEGSSVERLFDSWPLLDKNPKS